MNFSLRVRENMSSLLINDGKVVARIEDPRYEGLLGSASNLRSQLDLAVLILDNLPGTSIDTKEMHRILKESKF